MTEKTTYKQLLGLPSWPKISRQKFFSLQVLCPVTFLFPGATAPWVLDMHFTGVSEGAGTSYLTPFPFCSSLVLSPPNFLTLSTSFHPYYRSLPQYYTFSQYLEEPPTSSLQSTHQLSQKGGLPTWERGGGKMNSGQRCGKKLVNHTNSSQLSCFMWLFVTSNMSHWNLNQSTIGEILYWKTAWCTLDSVSKK